MNRPVKAVADFVDFTVPQVIALAEDVAKSMKGNPNFTTPDVLPDVINTQADVLENAYEQAQANTGSVSSTAAMNTAEKVLINSLKQQVRYVNHVAYGNEVAILSSGFHASPSETQPSALPGKAVIKVQSASDAGSISISISGVSNARCFTAVVALEGVIVSVTGGAIVASGPVIILSDTHHKMTVTGLQSGKRYNVVVFATGIAGISPLSDVKTIVTQ